MEQRFAIKRPDAWLWQSNLPLADVLSQLEKCHISRDWLVCPQGSADRAVTVGQLVDDPTVFLRQDQEAANKERRQRAIAASVEKPALLRLGQKLLRVFWTCLVIGGITVKILFPHMMGVGLTPTTLAILVPIWSIGGIGLIASLLGWLQYRYQVRATLQRELGPTGR